MVAGHDGFFSAAEVAAECLCRTSSFHVQISGAHLTSALLDQRNLPMPVPVRLIFGLIASTDKHLTPHPKKYVSIQSSTFVYLNAPLLPLGLLTSLAHSLSFPLPPSPFLPPLYNPSLSSPSLPPFQSTYLMKKTINAAAAAATATAAPDFLLIIPSIEINKRRDSNAIRHFNNYL